MDKNKLKIGRVKPQADDGLKPMEYKRNYENRPDIPKDQKISEDDYNPIVYNILDLDKRIKALQSLWETTKADIDLTYRGINVLYNNVKWNKIYDGQQFSQKTQPFSYVAGAQSMYVWAISEDVMKQIADTQTNKYILFIFQDGNGTINRGMFKNNLITFKWEPKKDDTSGVLANGGNSVEFYGNVDYIAAVGDTFFHYTNNGTNFINNTLANNIQSSLMGGNVPASVYMADFNYNRTGRKIVFAPFAKDDWILEGIYGRREDPIATPNPKMFVQLIESQMENNANSPYATTWGKDDEADDPKIQAIIDKGKAGDSFRFSLLKANKTAPNVYFVNDRKNGNYYIRVEKTMGATDNFDITCSNPSSLWSSLSAKPSKFYKQLLLDGLDYTQQFKSNPNFLNEWATFNYSLFGNLHMVETPIFANTYCVDYLPTIALID